MRFQKVKGMRDIFEEDWKLFEKIEKACGEIGAFYGYKRIETPILEFKGLFEKGTGANTDIVEKQMFVLKTKGGDCLALRPEETAPVVRAYLENGMENQPKPVKLWYFGPMFRYERPQAGRWRQFYQFGFEALGAGSWAIDAQIIQIVYNVLKSIGLTDLVVEINSIGDFQCRPYYKKSLTAYLRKRKNSLCPDCQRRLRTNPLRVLDCKQENCQTVLKEAPQSLDYLCDDCRKHFKNLLESLEELSLPYNLNPRLVRGLDYYTRTVFEIISKPENREASNNALVGGGRYDALVKLLGGKDTPACGAAGGAERVIALIKEKGGGKRKLDYQKKREIFIAQVGELAKKKSLSLIEEFRANKIPTASAVDRDSLSVQLKLANKAGAAYVLIIGQKEALEGKVIVKDMKLGRQKTIALNKIVREMKKVLKSSTKSKAKR